MKASLFSVNLTYAVLFLQNDLLQLVQPFGAVNKLVMLRAKNQVFTLDCFSFFDDLHGSILLMGQLW